MSTFEDQSTLEIQHHLRCIECFVEYPTETAGPFFLCDACQQRGHLVELPKQSFRHRKSPTGREQVERHAEILRKMGQGRLSGDVEIFTVSDGQWKWVKGVESVYFAGVSIGGSSDAELIEEKQRTEQKLLSQNRWRRRWHVIRTFVGMIVVLVFAYTGWERGWFVVDSDPFAVRQGDDLPVPEDLLLALEGGAPTNMEGVTLEQAFLDSNQRPLLEKILRADLRGNPRQGVELLQWLQLRLWMHNPRNGDSAFPMSWLQFALSLHHDANLGHRLKAFWYLSQGDADSMKESLALCPEDQWCNALTNAKGNVSDASAIDVRMAAEYALSFNESERWSELAEMALQQGQSELAQLLEAEWAIAKGNWQDAKSNVAALQNTSMQTLRLQLWQHRYAPSAPTTATKAQQLSIWKEASVQTQGAWALAQSASWLRSGHPDAGKEIASWVGADNWFEGDFPELLLANRFRLIQAQQAIEVGEPNRAIEFLSEIQSNFEDPLLNFWLGLQWVQLDRLRNAVSIADSMDELTPHHWMLKVLIAIQSQSPELLEQALERVAATDASLLVERTMQQQWVPKFNWIPLLEKGEGMVQNGKIQAQYASVLLWLSSLIDDQPQYNPNRVRSTDRWETGWLVRAQYAFQKGQFDEAHRLLERYRRLSPDSVTGEILSQLINIEIDRADIAKRELALIAQRERSVAWGHWLSEGFAKVQDVESAELAKRRWYREPPSRNLSVDNYLLFDELPHD